MKREKYIGSAILFLFFFFIAFMGYRSWHQSHPLTFLGIILAGFILIPLVFALFRIADRSSPGE
jgi:uncharacterized membrane protein YcaP (DUF421 family)